jgi:hypothetical protein
MTIIRMTAIGRRNGRKEFMGIRLLVPSDKGIALARRRVDPTSCQSLFLCFSPEAISGI